MITLASTTPVSETLSIVEFVDFSDAVEESCFVTDWHSEAGVVKFKNFLLFGEIK